MKDYVIVYETNGNKEVTYISGKNQQHVVDKFGGIYLDTCKVLVVAEVVGDWKQKNFKEDK